MPFALLIFIVVPLLEMLVLFEVADQIGGIPTLLMVVLTAVIGVKVLQQQGFSTLMRANDRIRQGQIPAKEIIEGMLLAAAGAMLLTPGFLTDTVGFFCLTGPVRRPLAGRLFAAGFHRAGGSWSFSRRNEPAQGHDTHVSKTAFRGQVFEGEYSKEGSESPLGKENNSIAEGVRKNKDK
ncbi:MAG: biotin--acetyl-CoA-carboxylase ligase [Gammaproteobacteria bacterium]|nr:biotin--acetyl-CoA-carboxylase ligase [Gammaproteobacteria bacterium]